MRTPWCCSYLSFRPRRIEIVSSTVGSLTNTGWKRRASAASFSTCFLYSSSVVAPMQCSSPRASAGLSRLEASIAPSALPAPTSVCISSMNRMMPPSDDVTSLSTALSRSSNSPRYFAPAISAPMSSASSFLSSRLSGTSPLTMRSARPSTIAVLPTPGSPISTGLFLVRRDSTWMVRRISSSRPITGSSLPSRAACGEVAGVFLQRVIGVLGRLRVGGAALAQRLDRGVEVLRRDAGPRQDLAGLAVLLEREREQQPLDGDEAVAGLLGDLLGVVEQPRGRGRQIDLAGAAAGHLRHLAERRLDRRQAPAANCRRSGRSGRPPAPPGRRAGP